MLAVYGPFIPLVLFADLDVEPWYYFFALPIFPLALVADESWHWSENALVALEAGSALLIIAACLRFRSMVATVVFFVFSIIVVLFAAIILYAISNA